MLLAGALVAGLGSSGAAAASPSPEIHVVGNHLVNASGNTVRAIGVDRQGAEASCVQRNEIFDGPTADQTSVNAMVSWGINTVRVPLNEDCWLGINGVGAASSGANYRQAIQGYVANLHQAGMVVILDLHWNGPGNFLATKQLAMADADHSPDFWRSVATTFLADRDVIFDLYNEPFIDAAATSSDPWTCWRNGCTIKAGNAGDTPTGGPGFDWQSAGMQSLVDAVRSTGATQPVMAGGLYDANDLSGWLAHRPTDPANQLVASLHTYAGEPCADAGCWDAQVLPVAQVVPVVTGEFGQGGLPSACATNFINGYMQWADTHGISYLAWAWFVTGPFDDPTCLSFVTDYSTGQPTVPYGQALKTHFLSQQVPVRRPVADFDGDGRTDIAVFRPPTGQWLVRGISDTVFGASTDVPVPGDYNGDGRTDIAVFRPPTGQWLVRGISDTVFGASTDVPVPGDYNGDGRTDIAVFRPPTGQWLVRGISDTVYGASTDVAVALPSALRQAFFMS